MPARLLALALLVLAGCQAEPPGPSGDRDSCGPVPQDHDECPADCASGAPACGTVCCGDFTAERTCYQCYDLEGDGRVEWVRWYIACVCGPDAGPDASPGDAGPDDAGPDAAVAADAGT